MADAPNLDAVDRRMSRPDGGPAFPRPASEDTTSGSLADGNDLVPEQDGMSLRDYFAAKAMATCIPGPNSQYSGQPSVIAKYAYQFADAMIAERAK